jgi:CheY-like chemotaxis protein
VSAPDPYRELGIAAAHMLHDVMNLVLQVEGRLEELLAESMAGRVNVAEMQLVLADSRALHAMARDVCAVLRGDDEGDAAFRPDEVTTQVLRSHLRLAGRVVVRASLTGGLPPVAGRSTHFERAAGNLLRNALRHARTAVMVTLVPQERGGRPGALLAVEDDGSGVDPALAARIFEPGVHGGHGGAGIGLASARWEIMRLQGSVTLEEPVTLGGARFEIWVPSSPAGGLPPAPARDLAGRRVALLEDEPGVRRLLTRLLVRLGAEVRAREPEEELDDGFTAALEEWEPDAIILDVNLGRHSGTEILRRLRGEAPDLAAKVIFLSGAVTSGTLHEAPCLAKPVGSADLVDAVLALSGGEG